MLAWSGADRPLGPVFEANETRYDEMQIQIRKNVHDEFEVPCPSVEEIYYTDDRDDAIGTARMCHGDDVVCTFRNGSYDTGGE